VQKYYPVVVSIFLLAASSSGAAVDQCAVCGAILGDKVYIVTDAVTHQKRQICGDCVNLPKTCFRCGLPVKKDYTELADGRALCARDVKNAVLDDDVARETIIKVQDELDRLFSRFISFPATNLDTAVVDRVNLTALFAIPGRDYECPNILGYTQSKTNGHGMAHKISVLSGLPKGELEAVCAHELTHAWVFENVSASRRKMLGSDAHEGFCELVAYLLMDSHGDDEAKDTILQNRYTRGQIDLFIEAERRFGFNEIVEWMKQGQDSSLHKEDLNRVRDLELATSKPATNELASALPGLLRTSMPPAAPRGFILKGISWTPNRPSCVINNRTFEMNEQGSVRIDGTNAVIRCLAIRQDGARIRLMNSGQERELVLENN